MNFGCPFASVSICPYLSLPSQPTLHFLPMHLQEGEFFSCAFLSFLHGNFLSIYQCLINDFLPLATPFFFVAFLLFTLTPKSLIAGGVIPFSYCYDVGWLLIILILLKFIHFVNFSYGLILFQLHQLLKMIERKY